MAKITRTRKSGKSTSASESKPASSRAAPASRGRGRRAPATRDIDEGRARLEAELPSTPSDTSDELADSAEEMADRIDAAAEYQEDDNGDVDAGEGEDTSDDADDDSSVATESDGPAGGSPRNTDPRVADPRSNDRDGYNRRPDPRYSDRGYRDGPRDYRDNRDNRYNDRNPRNQGYDRGRPQEGGPGGSGQGGSVSQGNPQGGGQGGVGGAGAQQQDFRRDRGYDRGNDRGGNDRGVDRGGNDRGGNDRGGDARYNQNRPAQGYGPRQEHRQADSSQGDPSSTGLQTSVDDLNGGGGGQSQPATPLPPPQPELLPFNPALPAGPKVLVNDLQTMDVLKLQEMAKAEGIADVSRLKKQEVIVQLLRGATKKNSPIHAEGVLEVFPEGFGFMRSVEYNFLPSPDDFYVSPSAVRKIGLRSGHVIKGMLRPPRSDERFFSLMKLESVNGEKPQKLLDITNFEDMTPVHPKERLVLETDPKELNMRIVDLVTPIGKGQRMLIVAPPRTGKTVLMQKIANAISKNHPEVILIILLIDERPEEVTDMKRHTSGMVCSSTFDEMTSRHVAVTEMVSEMAKRYVEFGKDVVILMDSITRMARAYNTEVPSSGKILSGGVDANALQRPKRFFGAARALEEHGSLTIMGTALTDTGSKMDEVIFEEFKGTGNAELHLDRRLVDKRVYPSIDINASGTRREELLLDKKELELVYRMRRVLADMNPVEAIEMLKSRLGKVSTNAEFLMTMSME